MITCKITVDKDGARCEIVIGARAIVGRSIHAGRARAASLAYADTIGQIISTPELCDAETLTEIMQLSLAHPRIDDDVESLEWGSDRSLNG